MQLTYAALEAPAWEELDARTRSNARTVLTVIVDRFGGVLIGPGALARKMIEDEIMGQRSVLEALNALIACGLLRQRDADGTPVFWVPDRLVEEPSTSGPSHRGPPGAAGRVPPRRARS